MKRWFKSFSHAFHGLFIFYKEEFHAKVHTVAAIAAVALSIYLRLSPMEWCIIILCIGMVIAAEILNTSIERLCDKVTLDHDALIKKTKDLASAAVLIVSIMSVIISLIIFIPKIFYQIF